MVELVTIKAMPCLCRNECKNGAKNKNICPCFIARVKNKDVVFCYCKNCGKLTWHIGSICVKCRARAMGF